jgi:excisionase family DNA binding protein
MSGGRRGTSEAEGGTATAPQLVSMREASARLGLSLSKAYQLVRAGRLTSLRIDGSRRVSIDSLRRFVEDQERIEAATRRGEVL